MKKIALDIDQMKHLQSLGIDTSNASMYWVRNKYGKYSEWFISYKPSLDTIGPIVWDIVPTFTLQDIFPLIEQISYESAGFPILHVIYDFNLKTWNMGLRNPIGLENPKVESPSLLETAYNMLVWMIENGLFQKSGKN